MHLLRTILLAALVCPILTTVCVAAETLASQTILIEAEGFDQSGGWFVDQQFMDQMGSPMLLAHGMGVPVDDATTKVAFPNAGTYRVWVRTRDWVAPWRGDGTSWSDADAPGRFQLWVDGKPL
ncbi:MAG TPA: NADH-dependent oxidoreductase, partial [Thermoguttaceae bacterium]|nr:NADH-dependent oxidoreductase [Thermoguttaceae bacterium]